MTNMALIWNIWQDCILVLQITENWTTCTLESKHRSHHRSIIYVYDICSLWGCKIDYILILVRGCLDLLR